MDLLLPNQGRPGLGSVPSPGPSSVSVQPESRPVSMLSSLAGRLSGSVRVGTAGHCKADRRAEQLRQQRQRILELRMANAESYDEWEAAARLLDELEEHEAWKTTDESNEYYNPELISRRLQDLESAQASSDIRQMLHLVRTALSRDVGGISSADLYNHSHTGTKHLVERYVKASVGLIQALLDCSRNAAALPRGLTNRHILDQLLLARRSYGRSALILSGGSVYGMAHIGVLKGLYDRHLLPRIISGTSAGSIVAAVLCTHTNEEVPGILERFAHGDLAVFTDKDNPDSWLTHIARALRYGSWHDSRHISRVLRGLLGDMTFQEAFNRTRRILNITVSSKPGLQLPPLLNYLTAPDVIIWSAVVASCSIPGVFDAQSLLVRDADTGDHVPWDPAEQLWIDGSLDNDVPVERLGEILNVNHFIVSQANPHIVVFVTKDEKHIPTAALGSLRTTTASASMPSASDLMYTVGWLSKSELTYCLESMVDMGVFRGSLTMLLQMLNQKYTADINILPRMGLTWGTYLMSNPTPEFMLEACTVGERATWPSISRIEHACAVELALDRAVYTLRERTAFSDSQVNLRRFFTGAYELGVRPRAHSSSHGDGAVATDADSDDDTDPEFVGLPAFTSGPGQRPWYYNHRRRGSGSSVQLSARRWHNRHQLTAIFNEDDGHNSGHDSDIGERGNRAESLSARCGMGDMNLTSLFKEVNLKTYQNVNQPSLATDTVSASPAGFGASSDSGAEQLLLLPYRSAAKQNSLQHLPMLAKIPSPSAPLLRKNSGLAAVSCPRSASGLSSFTIFNDDDRFASKDHQNGDESPMLTMKGRRRSSTSSSVSVVSAAAAAAVAAAHQAVMQAVGGIGAPAGPLSDAFRLMANEPVIKGAQDDSNSDTEPYQEDHLHLKRRRRLFQRSISDPAMAKSTTMTSQSPSSRPPQSPVSDRTKSTEDTSEDSSTITRETCLD